MGVTLGRPTTYSDEVAIKICERIAKGESLRDVCESEGMPTRTTVHNWLLQPEKKVFFDQYERACNIRAENMFDELEKIADNPDTKESPMRSRLRVDTRKWYLSKVLPKKFGDKLDVTSDNKALPQPLLHVLHHTSDSKAPSPEGEN